MTIQKPINGPAGMRESHQDGSATPLPVDDISLTHTLREVLWGAGFRPVPVHSADKRPAGNDWRALALQNPPASVLAPPHADALNTGILTDGLRAIDIDVDDRQIAAAVCEVAVDLFGRAPTRTRSNSGRCLLVYRAAEGQPPKRVLRGAAGAIEVLGAGQQFVAFWRHPSGVSLEWMGEFPGEVKRQDLIAITEDAVDDFFAKVSPIIQVPQPDTDRKAVRTHEPPTNAPVPDLSDVIAALAVVPGDDGDYDRWIRIGMATWSATGGAAQGLDAWQEWSAKSPQFDPTACAAKWSSFSTANRIGAGTLVYEARQVQPNWVAPSRAIVPYPEPIVAIVNRTQHPCPELPVQHFGPFWAGWIGDAARATNAAPDYVALPLLAAASGLIGNARWVQAWPGWDEPPILWCASVGEPSSGKSPGAKPVMSSILREVEAWTCRDYSNYRTEWAANVIAAQTMEKAWQAEVAAAAAAGEPLPVKPAGATVPPEPPQPCARVSSVTIEKLGAILGAQPKGVLCSHDELANWLSNLNRYSGGSDRPFWLESYVGGPFRIDRVRSPEPVSIPHLSVPIFGTIQPDKLADIWRGADDGLASRFLWTWPEARPFRRPSSSLDMQRAVSAMCRLADLAMLTDESGRPAPSYIRLADSAAGLLEEFALRLQPDEQQAQGLLKGAMGKARGQALRLALVLEYLWWATSSHPEPTQVSVRAMDRALTLMREYFLPMARRVLADAAIAPEEHNARTLACWIADTHALMVNISTIRDKAKLPGLRKTAHVRAACRYLEEAGWLLAAPDVGAQGGRPRGDYKVNPRLWDALNAAPVE